MPRWNRIAWRLIVVVLGVFALVLWGAGLYSSRQSRQHASDAVAEVMAAGNEFIIETINQLMASGRPGDVLRFLASVPDRHASTRDVSLIRHPSGEMAVTRLHGRATSLPPSDARCIQCHAEGEIPAGPVTVQRDLVIGPDGQRAMRVITPIGNETGCRNAACHAHTEDGTVLGILSTEYSLAAFDANMSHLYKSLAAAGGAVLLIYATILALMFRAMLARPLHQLVAGIKKLSETEFAFRFSRIRDDEIGLAKSSFNELADYIQRHERDLRRARDHLEGIVENTADIIITVDTQSRIRSFNNGAELALGYPRDEVVGKRIEMLFEDPAERDKAIARLKERDNVTNWQTRFRTKDGDTRHVLLTISRLRTREGELLGTLGISKDITREIKLQQQLIRRESEAATGRAVTAIQHAIKNMLNTLGGGLYLVRLGRKRENPERIDEGCEMVELGLERISDLAQSMLKYAREWKIEPEPVDLTEMVRKILIAVSATAR